VDCGTPWTWDTATSDESIALIAEDVANQVKAGYAQVITREELCKIRTKILKVLPLAVVPQRNGKCNMILDLSCALYDEAREQKGTQTVAE
jgi:hypothetical protein